MPFWVKVLDTGFILGGAAALAFDAPTVAFFMMVIATIAKW